MRCSSTVKGLLKAANEEAIKLVANNTLIIIFLR
jgi:hypothetical protein